MMILSDHTCPRCNADLVCDTYLDGIDRDGRGYMVDDYRCADCGWRPIDGEWFRRCEQCNLWIGRCECDRCGSCGELCEECECDDERT